jgi:hypothetical protein
MGEGCKNSMTPLEIVNAYAGTWELNSTYYHDDSIFIHKAWLIINKDSTFNCNASFFLRKDSLRFQPISGKWTYGTRFLDSYVTPANQLFFCSDTLCNSWDVVGTAKEGFMNWIYQDTVIYRWKLQYVN